MTLQDRNQLDAAIQHVVSKFLRCPNAFLTEEDLRVHLCSKLLNYFGAEEQTNDGDRSIALHTEVRWYGIGNMKTRSDIVLVEVSSLAVLRHRLLPSKGYGFNIPKAIIELKLRRPNGESNPHFLEAIETDLNKLRDLHQLFRGDYEGNQPELRLIVFDKKRRLDAPPPVPDGVNLQYEYANRSEPSPAPYGSPAAGSPSGEA
jgi:hypothetical protein